MILREGRLEGTYRLNARVPILVSMNETKTKPATPLQGTGQKVGPQGRVDGAAQTKKVQ